MYVGFLFNRKMINLLKLIESFIIFAWNPVGPADRQTVHTCREEILNEFFLDSFC